MNTNKNEEQCQSTYELGSLWSPRRLRWELRQQLGGLHHQLKRLSVPVYQALAGVLIASKRATSNNRTYAALILFFVVAPLSEVAYLWLDKSAPVITWYAGQHWITYEGVRVEGWYYKNFFWLFYQLGPHIQDLVLYTGAFCLIHKNDKRRWLAAIAMGFPFAKIIWTAQITSDAEIHQIVHWALLLIGILIALVWIVLFEYLMNLHYHKIAGHKARAKGLLMLLMMSLTGQDRKKAEQALSELEKAETI